MVSRQQGAESPRNLQAGEDVPVRIRSLVRQKVHTINLTGLPAVRAPGASSLHLHGRWSTIFFASAKLSAKVLKRQRENAIRSYYRERTSGHENIQACAQSMSART